MKWNAEYLPPQKCGNVLISSGKSLQVVSSGKFQSALLRKAAQPPESGKELPRAGLHQCLGSILCKSLTSEFGRICLIFQHFSPGYPILSWN